MNLYRISQNWNDWYDTYDSAIVASESAEKAKLIHPDGCSIWDENSGWDDFHETWCNPEYVKVELITEGVVFDEGTVILASFNAG